MTVDSVLSVPGLPKRRGRAAALYALAVVVVAVGAGLAARSGSGGAQTPPPTAALPSTATPSPPATPPQPPAAPDPPSGRKITPVDATPPTAANGAGEGGGAVVPTQGTLPVGVAPPGTEPAVPVEATPDAGEAPATADATTAVLTINTEPWTKVEIDGANAGTTPVLGRRVRPGRHTIRLTNPARNITRSLSVTLRAGERRRIVLDLTDDTTR